MFKVMAYSQTASGTVESSTELDSNTMRNKTLSSILGFSVDTEVWVSSSPMERKAMIENAANNRNNTDAKAKNYAEILASGVESSSFTAGGSWQ